MGMSAERRWFLLRDAIAFLAGIAGVVSQLPILKHGPIDPVAVALFGPLIGAPFILQKRKGG